MSAAELNHQHKGGNADKQVSGCMLLRNFESVDLVRLFGEVFPHMFETLACLMCEGVMTVMTNGDVHQHRPVFASVHPTPHLSHDPCKHTSSNHRGPEFEPPWHPAR